MQNCVSVSVIVCSPCLCIHFITIKRMCGVVQVVSSVLRVPTCFVGCDCSLWAQVITVNQILKRWISLCQCLDQSLLFDTTKQLKNQTDSYHSFSRYSALSLFLFLSLFGLPKTLWHNNSLSMLASFPSFSFLACQKSVITMLLPAFKGHTHVRSSHLYLPSLCSLFFCWARG